MLKKTLTFKDFNGDEHTEDFYFHLNKAELIRLEVGGKGGSLHDEMEAAVKKEDKAAIMAVVERLIQLSYGKRSDDGKNFVKTQQQTDEFLSSNAYEALFMEMLTSEDAAAMFLSGLMPSDMVDATAKAIEDAKIASPPLSRPTYTRTRAELAEMPREEYDRFLQDQAVGIARVAE